MTTTQPLDQVLFESLRSPAKSNSLLSDSARQLGILRWLNEPAGQATRGSLVDTLMENPTEYTPSDFQRLYLLPEGTKGQMIVVGIFSMARLVEEFPYQGRPITPDEDYSNLYIAYSRDDDHYVALEISADETGILHVLLSHPQKRLSVPIDSVTDDRDLQTAIAAVHSEFVQRFVSRQLPHRFWGTAGAIGLVTPTGRMTAYSQKLEQMVTVLLQQGGTPPPVTPGFVRAKTGDTARRMRRFQMTFDSKNMPRFFLRTVYGGGSFKISIWEDLPAIDKAVHEKRFIDHGYLTMDGVSMQIIVTALDKFEDTSGAWELFLLCQGDSIRIQLDRDYQLLEVMPYLKPLGDIPETRYEPVELGDAVENWMDGLYMPGFMKILLQIVDARDGYVTLASVKQLLRSWLAAVDQAARS